MYQTIREFIKDVDIAATVISTEKRDGSQGVDGSHMPTQKNKDVVNSIRVLAFKKELDAILRKEIFRRPHSIAAYDALSSLDQGSGGSNEIKSNASSDSIGRTVLTLFGSAQSVPQGKQMFSSLQKFWPISPSRASQTADNTAKEDATTASNSTYFPVLRETALPNGISTTKVVPTHISNTSNEKSKVVTLGELFAPPSTVAPLNPPRQSRHTATRSQSVNWYSQAESTIPTRSRSRYHYANEHLPTGQWLTYNIATPAAQTASPEAKRKQRDRALSLSEPRSALPQEVVDAQEQALVQAKRAQQQAKDEALFRSVYSNFAPDHDDAAAVVPEKVKNKVWWNRACEQPFSAFDNELFEEVEPEEIENDDEERLFKEAVEKWVPEELPPELQPLRAAKSNEHGLDKDVEEILKEISELLETLNSYQRIRNLSLTANARTSAGQNSQLTAMSGSPSTPSSAEFDTYTILKTQLSLMIAMLPPYAVTKLNGEHLETLNISTKLQIEGKNYSGTMKDTEISSKSEPNPLPVAPSTAMRTTTPNFVAPARSTQYQQPVATPTPRTSYSSHPTSRPNAPSATYPSQQYSARPSSSASHYTPRSSYPTSQQPSSTSRPSYPTSQYNYQTPQASQAQYTNGSRQFSSQNGYSSYNQQYSSAQQPSTSAPVQGSQYQRPSQPGYQQRAQNSQTYNYGSMPNGRSASPQNSAGNYHGQRQTSASTNQNTPRPHYNAQASNISSVNTNSVTFNGTVGQHLNLSPEEQAQLMNRQKAQLAHQLQMTNGRQTSGTPQPAYGQGSGQLGNGMATAQTNGVTTGRDCDRD